MVDETFNERLESIFGDDLETPPNPELEKIRKEVLELKQNDDELAKNLETQLATVHAAYLFTNCGKPALAQICAVISSTPLSSNLANPSSWKHLASILGLTHHQIGCIDNYNKYSDCTEIVLKTYSQKQDATLDTIVMALRELKRYDALTLAFPHLIALEKHARREQIARTEERDDGYFSIDGLETEKATHDGILRPCGIKHLSSQLYITLRNLDIPKCEMAPLNTMEVREHFQQATAIHRPKIKKCSKRVLLTFAKDGEKIAYNVAANLRKARGQYLPIGVLILDEHTDLVEGNPEQFISHNFPKMDYIIPIITPKYLESIDKNPSHEECISSAIDVRFVQMIHTLMIKYYVDNSCKNDKFRSIIPDNIVSSMLNDSRMKGNLVLQAFVMESQLETLAMRILKKKKY